MVVIVLFALFRTMVVQLVNYTEVNVKSPGNLKSNSVRRLTGTTFPTTEQLVLMDGVPPDIMGIRGSAGTSHNAFNVLQTNNETHNVSPLNP